MSATAVQPLFDLFADQPDSPASGHGSLTLEQRILNVWEGLLRTGSADCPVCRGKLQRAGDRGICTSCGSTLS